MTAQLNGPLKREVEIAGDKYTITLTNQGLKIVPKGRRKGLELEWLALISGEAALATALHASVALPLSVTAGNGSRHPRTAAR